MTEVVMRATLHKAENFLGPGWAGGPWLYA